MHKQRILFFREPEVHSILSVSWSAGLSVRADEVADDVSLHLHDTTWQAIAGIASHPCADELRRYQLWKVENSRAL